MAILRAILNSDRWRHSRAHRRLSSRAQRPLSLHHVSCGSCGGCLVEVRALRGAAYDLNYHDIRFVEAPQEADLLVITGVVTRALVPALRSRWNMMARPKGLIALGDCALGEGPFTANYAVLGGVMGAGLEGVEMFDVALRGCPPSPQEILDALVRLSSGHIVAL